jgi:hypothetical protein
MDDHHPCFGMKSIAHTISRDFFAMVCRVEQNGWNSASNAASPHEVKWKAIKPCLGWKAYGFYGLGIFLLLNIGLLGRARRIIACDAASPHMVKDFRLFSAPSIDGPWALFKVCR